MIVDVQKNDPSKAGQPASEKENYDGFIIQALHTRFDTVTFVVINPFVKDMRGLNSVIAEFRRLDNARVHVDKLVKEYTEHGHCCPYCDSSELSACSYPEGETPVMSQTVRCNSCGASWDDVYKLSDIYVEPFVHGEAKS